MFEWIVIAIICVLYLFWQSKVNEIKCLEKELMRIGYEWDGTEIKEAEPPKK
jgi:hypothetical protein